jgi:hypothetical protein
MCGFQRCSRDGCEFKGDRAVADDRAQNSETVVTQVSLEGEILSWNSIYGYTSQSAVGRSFSMLVSEKRRYETSRMMRQLISGNLRFLRISGEALEQCLHALPAISKSDKRCHARLGERPHWQTRDEAINFLQ